MHYTVFTISSIIVNKWHISETKESVGDLQVRGKHIIGLKVKNLYCSKSRLICMGLVCFQFISIRSNH